MRSRKSIRWLFCCWLLAVCITTAIIWFLFLPKSNGNIATSHHVEIEKIYFRLNFFCCKTLDHWHIDMCINADYECYFYSISVFRFFVSPTFLLLRFGFHSGLFCVFVMLQSYNNVSYHTTWRWTARDREKKKTEKPKRMIWNMAVFRLPFASQKKKL